MAAPIDELADEVAEQLQIATGYTFERRIAPYLKRSEVETGRWIVVGAGEVDAIAARAVNRTTLTVDVAFQIALPDPTPEYPDPVENKAWHATQMLTVENVKQCFRPGGSLRDEMFLEFDFQSLNNTPIYNPQLMHEHAIFTAVLRLEFVGEIEAE